MPALGKIEEMNKIESHVTSEGVATVNLPVAELFGPIARFQDRSKKLRTTAILREGSR